MVPCVCGKEFKTERGMKIHRTKKGCLKAMSDTTQRNVDTCKSLENSSQDENHSAEYIQAEETDREFIQSLEEARERLKLPQASETERWEELDQLLVLKLKTLLDNANLNVKLETYGDIIYQACREQCGVKEPLKEKKTPQRSRRQRAMDELRAKKKSLKKQLRAATDFEKIALQQLWNDLKARHSALSRAEAQRKKRRTKKKNQDRFYRNPFGFSRSLFEQPKSGKLEVDQETLEEHLRKTYSGSHRKRPLDKVDGLHQPPPPEKEFNTNPPSFREVEDVVRKGRAKSAPGPNGIPYLLYKKCPGVLAWIHKLIRSAWKQGRIPQQWMCANGVYIPKEQNSTEINQFRPISLLNIEGKIFFAVMASRLTNYLLKNNYIDTSVQKGGIPGIPGCLEHATMIWDTIQRAKSAKKDLDVIWLDLANAYGSVPHDMIQLALEMYHIPDEIRQIIGKYFNGFLMRFTTKSYTTNWVSLDIGIAMGCTISPILFVLAMEVILQSASKGCELIQLNPSCEASPLRAFMDDTTILSHKESETRLLLGNLEKYINWCRMSFKPKKSRSLSLRKGKSAQVKFTVADQDIPTVKEEPVKSLGRWYDESMKDTTRGKETVNETERNLSIIDKCGLEGKHKLWCLQFMLIPKLLWPLLIYDICISTVEKLEGKINKYTRKWLGVPPGLSDVALYCRQSKLQLPLKSLTEEYKVGKVRLYTMLEGSSDEVIRASQPKLKTGRKWKVQNAVKDAEETLRMKEIIGNTQTNRQGLGASERIKWWSQTAGKEKRDMIIQEVRHNEEDLRLRKAIQQGQQGQWTSWEDAMQRSLSWNDIWHMSTLRTSYILRSAYDLLPSNRNLVRWGKSNDPKCPLCNGIQTVEHVLSSCKFALANGRYTWRHNRVLQQLATIIEFTKKRPDPKPQTKCTFIAEGGEKLWLGSEREPTVRQRKRIMDESEDWEVAADLPEWSDYPHVIKQSRLRPDIVLSNMRQNEIVLVELTVPYESRIEEANIYKREKYADLMKELTDKGYKVRIFAVEVGARGFVGKSIYNLLSQLNISNRSKKQAIRSLSETAEKSSHWIWIKRNDPQLLKE